MKFVASGGGTGGHVYPALTVLEALAGSKSEGSTLPAHGPDDLLWIGSTGGIEEEIVSRAGFPFVGLRVGGIRGKAFLERLRNLAQLAGGVVTAHRLLGRFRPDAVLVTGGYASVPVTLAAWLRRVPVVIYLPDIIPGLAVRFLGRFARKVAVTSAESRQYLDQRKVVVTGYPVRGQVFTLKRDEARARLGLDPGLRTLLVLGGSRGARSINRALVAGLAELLPACQIVHVSGRLDADWVLDAARRLPQALQERYHPFDYLHDMPTALVASDLAVARAGAATLGEFPAAGLAAVLVPYPYAGQHQQANADYLARHGAALVLPDEDLGERLVPTVLSLLRDSEALATMREASRGMAQPGAARAIAELLAQQGQQGTQ